MDTVLKMWHVYLQGQVSDDKKWKLRCVLDGLVYLRHLSVTKLFYISYVRCRF